MIETTKSTNSSRGAAFVQRDESAVELRLVAISGMEQCYAKSEDACLALLISRNYRLLSQIENAPEMRREYFKVSLQWLDCYLKNRRHSRMFRSIYFDALMEQSFLSESGACDAP
ncbi:MAG: hypothetical protein ACU833_05265 [Gammaproteobacteria bacterium]